MREYVKKFSTLASANNYAINDIPFTSTVVAGGGVDINLVCNEENKKLQVSGSSVEVVNNAPAVEMVDLGLPSGTLWAKTNIGAQSETEAGLYFAWGEIAQHVGWPFDKYTHPYYWNEYQYAESDYDELTKYCNDSEYGYNGYTDKLTELVATDDIVAVTYGDSCRMPTQDDFQELIDETDNEWVEDFNGSGVNGYKFTSKSDSSKYIFLPAAGYCGGSDLHGVDEKGYFWSSSLDTGYPIYAWNLYFKYGEVGMYNYDRCRGFSVRPVRVAQ